VMNTSLIRPVDSGNSLDPPRCPETGFWEANMSSGRIAANLQTDPQTDQFFYFCGAFSPDSWNH